MAFGIDDALAAGLPALGGILGGIFGSSDAQRQQQLLQQQIEELQRLGVPPVEAQQVALQQLQLQGSYQPTVEQAYQQGQSELNAYTEDPAARQAQMQALSQLQGITAGGGLSLGDRAQLEDALSQAAQQERGSNERLAQSMAERGISNSGLQLAQQLSNQQTAAQNSRAAALGTAQLAQQRALQALQQQSDSANQLRGQDFSQAQQKAAAQNAINQFNTQNLQGVAARNAAAQTAAQQGNVNRSDKQIGYNTDLANQQQLYNKGLMQQQYQNELAKQNVLGAARGQGSQAAGQQAQNTAQWWNNIGQGAGALFGQLAADDKKKKADEE